MGHRDPDADPLRQLTHDEYFVTADAAKKGVVITNTSKSDPIVMLKHFGENPDLVIEDED